jgi:hypothetical protein
LHPDIHIHILFIINEFICNYFENFYFFTHVFHTVQRPVDIKNRPRIPVPDEDPYSEAVNSASSSGSLGSGGSAGEGKDRIAATREQLLLQTQQFGTKRSEKPPKLPPRENGIYHHDMPKVIKVKIMGVLQEHLFKIN